MAEVLTLPTFQPDVAGLLDLKTDDFSKPLRDGLPVSAFKRLRDYLRLTSRDLGRFLHIPDRTLQRRLQRGQLTPEESDRLYRLARLTALAHLVFEEDQVRAAGWMTQPKTRLQGEPPALHADNEPGALRVEDMLYAIEFSMGA